MVKPNMYYNELKDSYLFYNIAQKTRTYVENHPGVKLLRMGIGDVSLPLCNAVIKALHELWMIKLQKVVFMDICQNVVLHF